MSSKLTFIFEQKYAINVSVLIFYEKKYYSGNDLAGDHLVSNIT